MALIYDKKTTPYLTPQLEFEQLATQNTGVVAVGPNLSLGSPSSPVLYRTTGNGLVYLEGGEVLVDVALPLNSVLLVLPSDIQRSLSLTGTTILIPALSPAGVNESYVGRVFANEIANVSTTPIPQFTSLFFGGITYFTNNI